MSKVPTTREVLPGAHVNIVLKADQPTGRTVQGTIAQLLTRGNHPRGIKVRLTDGRIGRVQSMVGGSAATASTSLLPVESARQTGPDAPTSSRTLPSLGHLRDVEGGPDRASRPLLPSAQAVGLDAFIKPAKKRGKAKKPDEMAPAPDESDCPVCGAFRGDVEAVTRHVESHFND